MFTNVVSGAPRHEICRLFAATLQLVNDGNVTLLQSDALESELEIELQTPVEAFKRLDNYLAPSVKLSQSLIADRRDGPAERKVNVIIDSPPSKAARRQVNREALETVEKENM